MRKGCTAGTIKEVWALIDFDEVVRYKKKSTKRPPKKANHKHIFEPCVFETKGIKFDIAHGIVDGPSEYRMGSYCKICGRVGPEDRKWWDMIDNRFCRSKYTKEAELQLNPETRTLPAFRLDDHFQKFVSIERDRSE